MRIFLVEDYEYYCRVTILGFRINFPNIKHIIRTLRRLNDLAVKTRYNTNPLDYGRYFFWSNEEKFTLKERMWYISQMFYEMVGAMRREVAQIMMSVRIRRAEPMPKPARKPQDLQTNGKAEGPILKKKETGRNTGVKIDN